MLSFLKPYKKAVAAVVGGIISVLAFVTQFGGLLPENVANIVGTLVTAATAFGVWWARNVPDDPVPPETV